MATKQQQIDFINKIAPVSQKAFKELGKVLPSICIAMACVECAYGTAGSVKYHSYLGQKVGTGKTATKYWDGKFFNSKTKEEYVVGQHTVIKDNFRAYSSIEQCVFNYYELLNTSLYKGVKAGVDYVTQMNQIKQCGYMTSSTEVNSVITIIRKFNLTQYDNVAGVIQPIQTLPTLKLGSKGSDVVKLQTLLNAKGFNCGKEDGIFGTKTHYAVRKLQEASRITIDGIVGKQTWAVLNA